ncbi:MAG: magnesium citrate secondary transporter [Bacteroidota bacterium]
MTNYIKHTLALLVLFIAHMLFIYGNIHIAIIDNYLDDILLLPIVLGTALFVQRKWIAKHNQFVFNRIIIIATWLYFCIMFEVVIPPFNKGFTADWLDCIAYGLGACYFYVFMNKTSPVKQQATL